MCMFGESVFALIPGHKVRAAKLTNRWFSGCWWGRDASSDEHLLGTKHGLLQCRSVRRKPPGEQWSRRKTIEARGTKWNFDVEMDSGLPGPTLESRRDEGMPTATAPMEIPTVPPPALPPEEHVPEIRVHSNSGGGDVGAKREMVTCDPFYSDPAKTIDKVVSYTNILEAPISELLQNAKAVMTPWTEQKRLNLHDETTACDQVQHSLFRAKVGKLQYITRVRPGLMFTTECLSYKLASPTLADLTRAKKVLRYLKVTRELNLFLTILALKPNDLNKTLKHITGYSDADWTGDPVTRKSTSCTLCYVDQFLLTSECRGQGLFPYPVENQKCMLLVHCQLNWFSHKLS